MNWKKQLYLIMAVLFTCTSSIEVSAPFLPLYLKELGLTDSDQLAWWSGLIFGISYLTAFLSAPVWGVLADRYGQKAMLLRAIICNLVLFCLMGTASSHLELFVYRLLSGLAFGMVPACLALQAAKTPKEQSGFAMGMLQSAHVGGSLAGPLIGGVLGQFVGFRETFFVATGILTIAALATAFCLESDRPTQNTLVSNDKEDSTWKDHFGYFFHQPILLFLGSLLFLLIFVNRGIVPQLSLYVLQFDTPAGLAVLSVGMLTGLTGVANLLSSPLLGKLADRVGQRKVLIWSLFAVAIGLFLHSIVPSYWLLLVVRFGTGLAIGGVFPVINTLVIRYSPSHYLNGILSLVNSFHYLGSLLGTLGIGYLAGFWSLRVIFIGCAFLFLIGMVGVTRRLPDDSTRVTLQGESTSTGS